MRARVLVAAAVLASMATPAAADCFERAAARYRLSSDLLRAVAMVESGGRQVTRDNTNGTEDVCMMQVNSWWRPHLEPYGIDRAALLRDRCLCIQVGAWILAQEVAAVGYTWRAVAQYHSRNPELQARYVGKVRKALNTITRGQ